MPIRALLALASAAIAPGTYTNEEEVYFAREANRPATPWVGIRADATDWAVIDAFGRPGNAPVPVQVEPVADGLRATFADGRVTMLRRARPVTCWSAVKRDKPKPDGSEDWQFQRGIPLHDQGGRAQVGGGDAPAAVIRMRNVVWPSGPNRPSLVLYIHSLDSPDRATAYAWADPQAARVGINLRWIQASCTIDGREPPQTANGERQ